MTSGSLDGVSLDVFVDWLIQVGNDIRRIDDYGEWLSRFGIALRGLPERLREHSILPLLHAFHEPDKPIRGAAAPTDAFQAEVRAVRAGPGKDIPHISAELLAEYASDLKQLGLLSASVPAWRSPWERQPSGQRGE